jgi:hypothetical protein
MKESEWHDRLCHEVTERAALLQLSTQPKQLHNNSLSVLEGPLEVVNPNLPIIFLLLKNPGSL